MNSNEKKVSTTSKTKNRHSNEEVDKKKEISKLGSAGTSKAKKKIWSLEDLTESMKPSGEELKFREERLKESDIFQKSSRFFRCTKCLLNFNPMIEKHEKVPVHPNLGVLMCEKCNDYYEDGEFSLDSDGEDKYCRWCGEGGTIFGCAKCICGFCACCLRRHFTSDFFKKVKTDDHWLCFFCNPEPLWHLRLICFLAQQLSKGFITSSSKLKKTESTGNNEENSTPESLPNSFDEKRKKFRKRICISSSDESEMGNVTKKLKLGYNSPHGSSNQKKAESFESIKSNVIEELEKVLRLSKHQFNFGANWCSKLLKKLESPDYLSTSKSVANECKKIKWFLSILSTNLVQFCNSVESVEKSIHNKEETKASDRSDKNESPYTTILQFLGFISSQIKIFMEKGINLSDILEATVYNDENIIGIKKKINSPSGSFKERTVNRFESQTNDSRESTQEQKDEGKDRSENSVDIFDDQNSEADSTEMDKELNCSSATEVETHHLRTIDPEEELQEILAILENA